MAFHHQPIARNPNLFSSSSRGDGNASSTLFRRGVTSSLAKLSSSASSSLSPVAAAQTTLRSLPPTPRARAQPQPFNSGSESVLRRNLLLQFSSYLLATMPLSLFHPLPSNAAAAETTSTIAEKNKTTTNKKPPPILPLLTTAARLHAIPTYTIVDGNGTPFHTYDKDSAAGIGYFFLSYKGAQYVLEDAKQAFDEAKKIKGAREGAPSTTTTTIVSGENSNNLEDDDDVLPESWGRAQIVTVPLDYALQLSIKSTKSSALNGRGKALFATYYQIIPDTNALNAALRIDDGVRYRERGRVPLFYVDGMTIPWNEQGAGGEGSGDSGGTSQSELLHPVYLNIKDLKEEWNKQHPNGEELPPVKVRELNETFRSMIRHGGNDVSVRDVTFVPDSESGELARKNRVGRSYKLGEMILTK